jgi:hypothetical protein
MSALFQVSAMQNAPHGSKAKTMIVINCELFGKRQGEDLQGTRLQ